MMEELKNCPFCGEKAELKAANIRCNFTIWCQCSCGARTERYCPDTNNENKTMENIDACKSRAIKAWNRRVNDETD